MATRRWPIRMTHWINAAAMFIMIRSGWRISNASPFFSLVFPAWTTVGNWLGGTLTWYFAAMWVLTINLLLYLVYGLISGHLRRRMLPLRPYDIAQDFIRALRFRLPHEDGTYNAVQRLFQVFAGAATVATIAPGLALRKPAIERRERARRPGAPPRTWRGRLARRIVEHRLIEVCHFDLNVSRQSGNQGARDNTRTGRGLKNTAMPEIRELGCEVVRIGREYHRAKKSVVQSGYRSLEDSVCFHVNQPP